MLEKWNLMVIGHTVVLSLDPEKKTADMFSEGFANTKMNDVVFTAAEDAPDGRRHLSGTLHTDGRDYKITTSDDGKMMHGYIRKTMLEGAHFTGWRADLPPAEGARYTPEQLKAHLAESGFVVLHKDSAEAKSLAGFAGKKK